MEDSRLLSCQKYFVFKIKDLVNNSFHTLEEKRMESLSQYLNVCIDTYNELRASLDQDKLKRSYIALLEGLDYQIQNHPYRRIDVYHSDFLYLHKLITLSDDTRNKEIHNIHNSVVSLKKKLDAENIIIRYIQCILEESSFQSMDYLMETLVSDLLYMGYSMSYISSFFSSQQQHLISTNDIKQVIYDLKKLDRKPDSFNIHICFSVLSESQRQAAFNLLERQFKISSIKEIRLPNIVLPENTFIASKEFYALDENKAVYMAKKEFESIKELFDMWQGTKNCIKDDLWYICQDNLSYYKISLNSINNTKMISYIDNNYKKQMERFLHLSNASNDNQLQTLKRILFSLNSAKSFSIQNQFLNFWSSLEYILYPFPKFTIIEKARVIVPEVFALYYLKYKMNTFWYRLNFCIGNKKEPDTFPTLQQLCTECEDGKDYCTKKLISFLCEEEKYTKVLSELSFHIVLKRECKELIMLLTKPEKAQKAILEYFNGIRHDINYIYRLRNQLIHSAKDVDDSLEYISFRLYRYVNSVLSTILYYEEKNSEYNITDILSSIDSTYQDYTDMLSLIAKKSEKGNLLSDNPEDYLDDLYRLVRPKYLFIE